MTNAKRARSVHAALRTPAGAGGAAWTCTETPRVEQTVHKHRAKLHVIQSGSHMPLFEGRVTMCVEVPSRTLDTVRTMIGEACTQGVQEP